MKYILSELPLLIIFILIGKTSNAQNTPQLVSNVQSGVATSLIDDNRIVVDENSDVSSFMMKIGIVRRADAVDKPFEIKGWLIIESGGAEYVISPEISFTNSDFIPSWSISSAAKDYLVTLIKPNKIGTIKLKYSEKVNGVWGAELRSNSLGSTKIIPVQQFAHITGPDLICSSEIYRAIVTDQITWEMNGIATVESTEVAHYLIKRIGNRSGKIRIISRLQGQTQIKEITIGDPTESNIKTSVSGNLDPSSIYSFYIEYGGDITSYDWSVTGGTIVSGKNSNFVEIRTDPNPFNVPNNISVSVAYTARCGSGIIHATRYVSPAGGRTPIDFGDTM